MRFDTSQHMRLGQHMKLAPHMIQSMEILQMNVQELEERINQELESNVALERAEDVPDGAGGAGAEDGVAGASEAGAGPGESRAEFERLEQFEASNPDAAENEYSAASRAEVPGSEWTPPARGEDGERDAKSEAMANTAARPESLTEQLLEQWGLTEVEPSLRALGDLIIGYLDDDGYLRTPLATIAERAGGAGPPVTVAQLERALRAVQLLLDPPGIAARDTRECLLLQLDALEAEPGSGDAWALVRRIVEEHLEDVAQNRLPRIAQKTGAPLDEVGRAVAKLRTLSPAPARRLVEEAPPVIVPDAIVEYDPEHDRYVAYLNDSRLPNLRVNQEYARMTRDRQVAKPTRDFIRKNLAGAQFLLEAIEQRRRTLLRVIHVVVDAQREFFDYGPQALRPLPMTRVAEQLGVHVATVSRAVAEKWLQTPRGMVALRKFFTGGTQSESGEDVSWEAIKGALQEVVAAEDKANPLSDDAIAEELKKRGVEIARRTVAKYRGQLGIPSARLRKTYTA